MRKKSDSLWLNNIAILKKTIFRNLMKIYCQIISLKIQFLQDINNIISAILQCVKKEHKEWKNNQIIGAVIERKCNGYLKVWKCGMCVIVSTCECVCMCEYIYVCVSVCDCEKICMWVFVCVSWQWLIYCKVAFQLCD